MFGHLFGKREEECALCGQISKKKFSSLSLDTGDFVCNQCKSHIDIDYSHFRTMSLREAREYINIRKNNLKLLEAFKQDRKLEFATGYMYIDLSSKFWYVEEYSFFNSYYNPQIYSFESIINYNLIKDGDTISQGRLGRALIGGILAGGIGALIGASISDYESVVKSLLVNISIDNKYRTSICLPIIDQETKLDSLTYENKIDDLNNILASLDYMISKSKKNLTSSLIADEILKLKKLMNQGIITKDEFERQKNKLLEK